jgi:hypothetical protein
VEHPELETFLADAPARIRQVFGPDIPLALEIAYDYEGPPGNRELWVMVSCPPDVDFAIDRLHTLDREWLVHLPRSLRGIANIDTEFR